MPRPVEELAEQFGDRATANEVIAEDHADALGSGRPPIAVAVALLASATTLHHCPEAVPHRPLHSSHLKLSFAHLWI